ncbi:MAG TPA: hypothetical protein VFY79_06725, partial [Dehalococcoidia bacterium]|nr:hypothetical protein [Dehalococcoidia bacterium]
MDMPEHGLFGGRLRALAHDLWPAQEAPAVRWQPRLLVALLVGVLATIFAYHQLAGRGWLASDFEYDLRAARRFIDGLNPYTDPTSHPGLAYPFDAVFPYPIFAALFAVPFTMFSSYTAGALYVGLLSAVMAFAVTRDGWWRLVIFLSPSYFVAASVANWSPLIVAAAYLPLLYPVALVKPTIAGPVLVNYPSRRGFIVAALLLVASVVIYPSWPAFWLSSGLHQPANRYAVPMLSGATAVCIVALLWYRMREARVLVMLACVPQHAFFYDQLLLWLLPRSPRQSLALSAVGWMGYVAWAYFDPGFIPGLAATRHIPPMAYTSSFFYLPAFCLVAWQA